MTLRNRVGVYGGTFDPVHRAHLEIAKRLVDLFELGSLLFVPAHRAPHKRNATVASAFDRYAMLVLATADDRKLKVSRLELDEPDRPYTIDTLGRLKKLYGPETELFFLMGGDSWNAIDSWFAWEELLRIVNHIVVTRPGHELQINHVGNEVRERIVDLRGAKSLAYEVETQSENQRRIYFTDVVRMDNSATLVREAITSGSVEDALGQVPEPVAEYIRKYGLYNNGYR